MFLALWYYLRGYVMIKVKGFALERFMNMLSYKGVYLWDVSRKGSYIQMKVGSGTLEMVQSCSDKTGCILEIEAFGGIPAQINRFKGRGVLLYGFLVFVIGLYGLSSFVWSMEVKGNQRVLEEEILNYCKEEGVYPGVFKGKVSAEELTKNILIHFPDISWVSVGVNGTSIEIEVAETIEKTEVINKEMPMSIVATHKGVIIKMVAQRGTPLVKEGDVVEEGDVLISADVIIGEEGQEQHTQQVRSEGSVMARIWREEIGEMPFVYEEKIYTEEIETNWIISLFGKDIDFVTPKLEGMADKEILEEKQFSIGDFSLPIGLIKEEYYPYVLEERSRSEEEVQMLLEEELRQKMESRLSVNGEIEKITIDYQLYGDRIVGKAVGSIIEQIGESKEAELNGWEQPEDANEHNTIE